MRKIISALILVFVLCSSAFALPSITMLSTKTCPACKQMSKVLDELNSKYGKSVSASHMYLEDYPDVAKQYNVRYVPTLIFRNSEGKEIAREVGYKSLEEVLTVFKNSGINI